MSSRTIARNHKRQGERPLYVADSSALSRALLPPSLRSVRWSATPPGSPQTRRRFASEAQDVVAPNGVPSSALPAEPFSWRFQASESGGLYPGYQGSRLHAPIGDTNADDEARKFVTVAKCLGEAIPALFCPQGSNPASAFPRPGMGGNSNLNTSNFKNGWPASRGADTNWKHSDCLDVR